MKDLLLRCRDVVTFTSSLGKKLRQNACTRAARHSTNQIRDFCRCRCRSRRHFLSFLFSIIPVFVSLHGSHQRENTGSRLFTEVKPCWTGDQLDKIPCAVLLGKSGWRSGHQSRFPPLLQCCMWIEFQLIST